jgi:hypothetical protein
MPHVQVTGPCRVEDLAPSLASLVEAQPPEVLKIQAAYLALDRSQLILEAIVVEEYLRQSFFLLLRDEPEGIMIRCHPFCSPQKTDAVKRLIARIARAALALHPACAVGHTNLQAFL